METIEQRSIRIINQLKVKYPHARAWDVDGRGMHFVSEIDPVDNHPEYDLAVEVIIESKPHKHLKMTQYYTVLSGILELHLGDEIVTLSPGDKRTIKPGTIHWALGKEGECWTELYSEPGWTKEDHLVVEV